MSRHRFDTCTLWRAQNYASFFLPPLFSLRYAEAATAYEAANDMDSVVRLALERLNAPQRAYAIVRKTRSVEAASQLARFCLQSQEFSVGALGARGREQGARCIRGGAPQPCYPGL
jgi:hypothetical protein